MDPYSIMISIQKSEDGLWRVEQWTTHCGKTRCSVSMTFSEYRLASAWAGEQWSYWNNVEEECTVIG